MEAMNHGNGHPNQPHGGGYVPQSPQQAHTGSGDPHGGGYVPQGPQQGQQQNQTGSGDRHGGGYVPGHLQVREYAQSEIEHLFIELSIGRRPRARTELWRFSD